MYLERETADELLKEEHGRIRRLLLKCRNKAKACTFVNRRILVHLLSLLFCLSDNAGRGNAFDINLNLFSGEGCLFVGLRFICRFLRFFCFASKTFHAAIKTCYGACITLFTQVHPEADKTCIGTTFTHPTNESDLLVCVFVRVMMRTTRLWRKGFGCTIVAITQSIDELAIGVVLNGSLCDAVLICIGKNRLIILDVLCYAFHEKASFVCGLFW